MIRPLFSFLLISLIISCGERDKAAAPIEEEPEWKPYLLYISNKNQGFDIYVNAPDGNAELQLTNDQGWEWRPQFVESGEIIIYNAQDTSGQFSMKAMDMVGTAVSIDVRGLPEFTISPDGQKVAYTRTSGNATNIIIATLDDPSDSLAITKNLGYNGRPVWSNEGDKIAYISDRNGSNEVYVYSLDDEVTTQLTDNKKREKYMSWAPDDSGLAVTMQEGDDPADIFIIDPGTKRLIQLTATEINESEISWSPDGIYIAYHAQVDEQDDIFTLEIENGKITKVTDGDAYYGEPTWVKR